MESLKSDLPKKAYLAELKGCFESPFAFLRERVTGFVIGPFFAVAHHTDYEWDRRFSTVSTRAWGYVKEREGKTDVKFIRAYGLLTPFWILAFTLLGLIIGIVTLAEETADIPFLTLFLVSLAISFVICLGTAIGAFMSERGEYSHGELTKLLRNPEEYYC